MPAKPGSKVRAVNRTYGLRPAEPFGPVETVTDVNSYNGTVYTEEGNCYLLTGYLIVSRG